jgi:hypothetical protein
MCTDPELDLATLIQAYINLKTAVGIRTQAGRYRLLTRATQ